MIHAPILLFLKTSVLLLVEWKSIKKNVVGQIEGAMAPQPRTIHLVDSIYLCVHVTHYTNQHMPYLVAIVDSIYPYRVSYSLEKVAK